MNIKKDIVKNFGFKEKTTIKAGVDLNLDLDYKNKGTEEVFLLSRRDKKELIDNVINKSRGITGIEKIEYKIGTKIFTLTYSKFYQKSGYSLEAKDPNDKIKRIYYS